MSLASFNGQPIFGASVSCLGPAINPRRSQENYYPGVLGVESLDMGDQGAFTTVSGRLYGSTPFALNAARLFFLSFYDGNAYVLVDNLGAVWPNVKLVSFEPEGRGEPDPDLGYSFRYTARFFHLTL